MAVKFKNAPGQSQTSDKTFTHLQNTVREKLKLPATAIVRVGVTETSILCYGVRAVLPFGVAQIKKDSGALVDAWAALQHLSGATPHSTPSAAPAPVLAADAEYNDMTDQQWVEHVAQQLFPGTVHLYQAGELYQPVMGTSGGSVYKTCFIGPSLKVAGRIKGNQVSFRATTNQNGCPTGQLRETLGRLGIDNEYEDRMTGHAHMGGPYDEAHAHEYRALFGAMYAALKPWITSNFPAIGKLTEGVK